jgi:uncharacterized caspase-like protein
MKKLFMPAFCLMASLVFISSAITKRADDKPKMFAVIVGISKYSDPNITFLKYSHRDAEAYRSFLESPKGGGIPSENIVLLTNERATRSVILKALREMFNKASDEDVVIFFFSGHGVPDSKINTDLYFTTYDTDDENYTGTALLKDDVARQFVASKAKLKLFLADACHSGGSGIYLGTRDDHADLINKLQVNIASIKEPSWAAITASSSSEKSFEDEKWGGGHGVFTYSLIQGLEGEADKTSKQNPKSKGNNDGIVSVRELFDYLSNVIPSQTNDKQHPDKQGKNEDIFPLSAVTVDKYAQAIRKYKKENPVTADNRNKDELTDKEEMKKFDTETRDLKSNLCLDNLAAYGDYCFVNNYGEDIVLTGVQSPHYYDKRVDMLIASGKKICLQRMQVSSYSNNIISTPSQNATFYFKTISEGQPVKYGTRQLVLEACKSKTEVFTKENLYLSVDGKRW